MATNNIEKQSFGQAGATFESGTTAVTGEFCSIFFLEDTVFTSLTWPELDGDTVASSSVVFPAGSSIFGQITAFQLSSGKVLAYKAV